MTKKYSSDELDAVFNSLSNATRRKILARLCKEKCSISQLAEPFSTSMAAISKHIKVLEKAGLVKKERQGTAYYCTATPEPAICAGAFVKFLESQISE